ncbi:MAG: peptidase U62 [Candidatus Aminicenantes bacterium]|nr:MAG: peptidase U62 [Candidatus Aminicenantes bacterium]
MKIVSKSKLKIVLMFILGFFIFFQAIDGKGPGTTNVVLEAMKDELARSMKVLGEKGSPPPYFICYQITDNHRVSISASFGALKSSSEDRSRLLDVDVRVGSYRLDNTHQIRGRRTYDFRFSRPVSISLSDDPDAIKSAIWLETDRKYKAAAEKLIQVKADKGVTVKEEDQSDDFSKEAPNQYIGDPVGISPDIAAWEKKLKEYSALFNNAAEIHSSSMSLRAESESKYFVNSEGTSLLHGRTHWRLSIFVDTKAEDGMRLTRNKIYDARVPENLPDDKTLKTAIHGLIEDLQALRNAPMMEPYTGPAILSGEAAGVFFHEIFGHRIEGHRQKDERDGQTFTKKINQQVLPTFMSVYDDPTLKQYDKKDLMGHYLYDDEGVKAQRAGLVEKGILTGFLMSRSPIEGFSKSNGHGRAQPGRRPVSRQGVLVVEASKSVPREKLRQKLIDECKTQGKPYGLLFDVVVGGFTFTGRFIPQAFNVTPVMVYRIYTDGRPDELVRGVDLIGTPLTSFSKVIAAGDKPEIFDGYCGAVSGSVPVSAVSPPLLTAQIEVQKKYKASEKPPVLPPPERRSK